MTGSGIPEVCREDRAARHLLEEHRTRKRFGSLPAHIAPRNIEEAYATQDAFVRLLQAERGPVIGYKVALTTPAMQKMTGFSEPAYGRLFENTRYRSPCVARHADYVRLGLECEVAIRLAADLPAERVPYRMEDMGAAIDALMPAFEVVEDRDADYAKFAAQVLDFIADDTWNAGVILGPEVKAWRDIDLPAARGQMFVNGEMVAHGHGRDVVGHPLNALAWLANTLAGRGKMLSRGMLVMTGSLVPTRFVRHGDSVRYALEGFGEVRCNIE